MLGGDHSIYSAAGGDLDIRICLESTDDLVHRRNAVWSEDIERRVVEYDAPVAGCEGIQLDLLTLAWV